MSKSDNINSDAPFLYKMFKAIPLEQHKHLINLYKQSIADFKYLKGSSISKSKHNEFVEKMESNHARLLKNVNNNHADNLFLKDSEITKQARVIEEKSEQINAYIEIAKTYNLDIEDLYKRKNRISTKDIPVVPPQGLENSDYLKEKIDKFHKDVDAINDKEKEKEKEEQELIHKMSKQQEDMVFSNNRSVCVLAGAGSGKSTSLILRVIFLYEYLEIPFEEITVCTFTVESRKDFIKKLVLRCKQWGLTEFSEEVANSIVRTFHSLAFEVNQHLGGTGKALLFDNDNREKPDDDNVNQIPNLMEPRKRKNNQPSKTEVMQTELLKALYSQNVEFRNKLNNLYIYSFRLGEYQCDWDYEFAHESKLSEICLNTWTNLYPEQMDAILSKYPHSGTFTLNCGRQLKYHIYLPNLGLRVFLGITFEQCADKRIGKYKVSTLTRARNTLVTRQVTTQYCIAQSMFELQELLALEIQQRTEDVPIYESIPSFKFHCQGDYLSKKDDRNLIHNQFENIIDFSYSIGVPLYTLSEDDINILCKRSECNAIDSQFIWLAWLFHRAWMRKLDNEGYTTFNDIFHEFASPEHFAYKSGSSRVLKKFSHLLIDEFQDISPNIIGFFRQIKRHLFQTQTELEGSLMCIGDDFQSIYGWRGSSAQYITKFERYFTTAHSPEVLPLEDNFRSHPLILEAAQLPIDKIKVKSEKGYIVGANYDNHINPGCHFYPPLSIKNKGRSKPRNEIDYDLAAEKLEQELKDRKVTPEHPIYVLYRASSNRNQNSSDEHSKWNELLSSNTNKIKVIKSLTIHSSKGLEADCVFVLGDISTPVKHPIREGLYYESGDISSRYIDMQRDECHRLAYVAITRAKQSLHWFFKSSSRSDNLVYYLLR
ncbi:UvrD-helicase domain-containing protein [Vibrio neptunius]|uniref:DNA 3'-5' helicase n=1 Tax=Vibrio neptunius TaxID=170651 RepID=A0ABS3A5Q2_9VIBR|nr:UvrD-helicase domain-containing protein [Vibrio neptunius]MBN3494380.1 UvrD-helicase domain-containing protein [Vibrio neptunius]MBN3516807.1 UvrD-helicase domain-containing protein [Vibrio neptunius]MBN3551075.1 UvrD-helicase domain-containing protein [Vibrio neptunius]MBN3579204.1 UvrD-helicase domain-containing protein [Vibrio neptunius]MCH9872868.1 UvrD-helicase domain-containing protein [Vibrio neptunius]